MAYLYMQTERAGRDGAEHNLFTVGFFDEAGKFHPESDYNDREQAAARAHWLNGGAAPAVEFKPIAAKMRPGKTKDRIEATDKGYALTLERNYEKRPSWRTYGDGHANIRMEIHLKTGVLSINASEHPEDWKGGKEVFVDLDKEAVRVLLSMLMAAKERGVL